MKLLTYKNRPVINLEQMCSMRIEHSNIDLGKYRDHSIVFYFHNNSSERWKMEDEEEATFIHQAIIDGILNGNEHVILEEIKEEVEELNQLTSECFAIQNSKNLNGEQKGTIIIEKIQKSFGILYKEAREIYFRWARNGCIGNI